MVNLAFEALQHFFHQLAGDVFGGISSVNLMLQIVAGRGGSQTYVGNVFLGVVLEFLDALRGPSGTHNHDTRSQRVKGSGMTHLELLYPMRRQM